MMTHRTPDEALHRQLCEFRSVLKDPYWKEGTVRKMETVQNAIYSISTAVAILLGDYPKINIDRNLKWINAWMEYTDQKISATVNREILTSALERAIGDVRRVNARIRNDRLIKDFREARASC